MKDTIIGSVHNDTVFVVDSVFLKNQEFAVKLLSQNESKEWYEYLLGISSPFWSILSAITIAVIVSFLLKKREAKIEAKKKILEHRINAHNHLYSSFEKLRHTEIKNGIRTHRLFLSKKLSAELYNQFIVDCEKDSVFQSKACREQLRFLNEVLICLDKSYEENEIKGDDGLINFGQNNFERFCLLFEEIENSITTMLNDVSLDYKFESLTEREEQVIRDKAKEAFKKYLD